MKAKDLRKQTQAKLIERINELNKEVRDLLFDLKTGSEKNSAQIKKKKKTLARILTILNEGSMAKEEMKTEKSPKKTKKESK